MLSGTGLRVLSGTGLRVLSGTGLRVLSGTGLRVLKEDGTADCDECGMPMFPTSRTATHVHLDCANRHYGEAPLPRDPAVLRIIENWLAKRGAQLHVQHERWGTDDERGRDKRDI